MQSTVPNKRIIVLTHLSVDTTNNANADQKQKATQKFGKIMISNKDEGRQCYDVVFEEQQEAE